MQYIPWIIGMDLLWAVYSWSTVFIGTKLCISFKYEVHIAGLMQNRRNSSVSAMELRLFCIDLDIISYIEYGIFTVNGTTICNSFK